MTFLFCKASHDSSWGIVKTTCTYLTGSSSLATVGEPLVASVGLAFRTMPGTARVERDGLEAALTTTIQVSAERCRAAVLDGEEDAEVKPGQPGSVLFDKAVAMRANDVGHLERWRLHFLCSLRERFTCPRLDSSALSSGVPAALRCRSDIWR